VRNEIRLTSAQWQELRQHLLADHFEHAAVVICGTAATPKPPSSLLMMRAWAMRRMSPMPNARATRKPTGTAPIT